MACGIVVVTRKLVKEPYVIGNNIVHQLVATQFTRGVKISHNNV